MLSSPFSDGLLCAGTSAGTGKSLLLKHILRALPQATTYVTASTGLAASVLGGITLNAFAGIQQSCCLCAVYGCVYTRRPVSCFGI